MRLHFIAIGGSIMHSLAITMVKRGNVVSGSDDEIYEPSRSRLEENGILPKEMGWHPDKITTDIDLIVLGMHARADNPELLKAQELGITISSFPEFMHSLSQDKVRVVIAGSHGKTTTSGMIAHALQECDVAADRMIGATIGSLEPVTMTDAPIIVLEGDEYLSSPLDPRPKFLHYDPDIVVITGIAWDHMNVFPTHEAYMAPFKDLIQSLRSSALLLYASEDQQLTEMVQTLAPACECIPYSSVLYYEKDGETVVQHANSDRFPMRIFGKHNMTNLAAASLVCERLGIQTDAFFKAMRSFTGANKRLQLLFANEDLISYLDFAHAPSKVKATVEAVREKYPGYTLVCCLELHTFSSLNPAFLPHYRGTLKQADVSILYYSPHTLAIKKLPDLTPALLAEYFDADDLRIATNPNDLQIEVERAIQQPNTVMLWMSSGRFDGLDVKTIGNTAG